ncbi:response regulator transcription factor [Alkaliphilus oremlandii]|uniref:Stage 0 sporulation protein A homolog n=1 Tax=Alkaliphilus oremlandii (strain OhILAs) TaxID=350688 RepID=A8MEK9_ALKOO|nr:response regulator transcription factor [Alkaliphilus oremlandii]ABW18338.1 two component transcriptional regulator, winged helix family [Alkaliphilus oremlandii OhILAs]
MKLLIIEDETDLVNALKKGFVKKGYAVDYAVDGEVGLELYHINEYDLIILDLNLPSMDGLEVLETIREKDKMQRVLILSARSTVPDRIRGLDMGANDYLPKPFDFAELDARVRSLLRCELIQHNTSIQYDNIILDTRAKSILVNGVIFPLAPREYAIFEYLLIHRGTVISAETLIEHIWDSEVNMFTDVIKVHISNIRKKLREASGKEYIVTVRGKGYLIVKEEGI